MVYRFSGLLFGLLLLLAGPAIAGTGIGVDKMETARMFGSMGVSLEDRSERQNGEYRWFGKTTGALSEAIGDFESMRSVSLMLLVSGDKDAQMVAAARALVFIKWSMPAWTSEQAQTWFATMIKAGGDTVTQDGRKLISSVVPSMGMITLTVEAAE